MRGKNKIKQWEQKFDDDNRQIILQNGKKKNVGTKDKINMKHLDWNIL